MDINKPLDYDSYTPHRIKFVKSWTPRLVAFGELIDGYDLLVIALAILFIKEDFAAFKDNPLLVGAFVAVAFIGAACGLLIFGRIADKFGRRPIFMINLMFFVVASIISAFAFDIVTLFIMRFIVGVAVGMDIPVSQAFLAEISPNTHRGRLAGSLPNIMWLIGGIISVICTLLIHPFAGVHTWRWLFGIAAIPAFIVFMMRRFLPESPRWLLEHGREEEAMKVFNMLELDPSSAVEAIKEKKAQEARGPVKMSPQSKKRLAAITAFFGLQAFGGGLATVSGPQFNKLIFGDSPMIGTTQLFANILGLLAVIIGAVVIDRVDRRKLGIVTCSILFFLALGLVWAGLASNAALLVLFYVAFSFTTWFGPGVLAWIWSAEAMPTEARGFGVSVAQTAARLMLALNGFIIPAISAAYGFWGIMIIAAAYPVVVIIMFANPWLSTTGTDLNEKM